MFSNEEIFELNDIAVQYVDMSLRVFESSSLGVLDEAADSRCFFCFRLPDFCCLTPYLSQSEELLQPSLLGLTLGNCRGALELVELPSHDEDPEVLPSDASHGGAVLQASRKWQDTIMIFT